MHRKDLIRLHLSWNRSRWIRSPRVEPETTLFSYQKTAEEKLSEHVTVAETTSPAEYPNSEGTIVCSVSLDSSMKVPLLANSQITDGVSSALSVHDAEYVLGESSGIDQDPSAPTLSAVMEGG